MRLEDRVQKLQRPAAIRALWKAVVSLGLVSFVAAAGHTPPCEPPACTPAPSVTAVGR